MTPKTVSIAAAARRSLPTAQKQLASLAKRTGRPELGFQVPAAMGGRSSHVEFAFLTTPAIGEIAPGMPSPTLAVPPIAISISPTRATIASNVA